MTTEFKKGLVTGMSLIKPVILGGGGGGANMKYSTDEQVVGEWIDGKPIYQISFSVDVTAYGVWINTDIGLDNIDNVVNIDYIAKRVADRVIWMNGACEQTYQNVFTFGVRVDGNYLSYHAQAQGYGITKFVGSVRYTKTTD